MKARKFCTIMLVAFGIVSTVLLPPARGITGDYLVQGIFQLSCPSGSRVWTVSLVAGHKYDISLGLYTPGSAHFTLAVTDPWAQDYTFVDLEFWHSQSSDDLYTSTFAAPLLGQYTFTLASAGGTEQALQVYFVIRDMGTISNKHTGTSNRSTPLVDAHACNLTHTVWTYFVPLEGNTTYFIDAARGDPNGTSVPIIVKAKVQALNDFEVSILSETLLPWTAPKCNETQPMTWTSGWFGIPASTTYNLVIEVAGLSSHDPLVVVLTISKEQTHGNSTPDSGQGGKNMTTGGLIVGADGVIVIGGICIAALAIVAIVAAGGTRKKSVQARAGEVKRDVPQTGW